MKKLTILFAVVLTAVLIVAMLFSSGCSCLVSPPQPYGPRVTGDGTGGAIAVYEDIKGGNQHDFYAQRISPEGEALWGEKGVLVGSGYKGYDSFFDLHIVSDGYGGALVSWIACPSSQETYVSYVTKVDAAGSILWQKEVWEVWAVNHMISDGAGGAIVATDYGGTVFIKKIDSEGNFTWGGDGGLIQREGYQDNTLQLAGDGTGGAIVVWQESPEITDRIVAQRIDSEGRLPWGQAGVLLYTTPEEVYAEEPKVISDGSGGAIAIWQQTPKERIESGMPEALLLDIYAQRVDAQGKVLWVDNGVPLGITKGGGECPSNALVVSDGAGGAIIIWEDLRKGLMSMYAQKIDAEGNIKWRPGGEEVCYIKTNSSFWPRTAVSDGSGGAIIAWGYKEAETNKKGLLIQRLDAVGRTMWPDDGILFTQRGNYTLAGDGQGGAIIAWGNGKSTFRSESSCVQRVDSEGKLLWGKEGIRLDR